MRTTTRKKRSPKSAYVVVGPQGGILVDTTRAVRRDAWCALSPIIGEMRWWHAKSLGYRIVRVTVALEEGEA